MQQAEQQGGLVLSNLQAWQPRNRNAVVCLLGYTCEVSERDICQPVLPGWLYPRLAFSLRKASSNEAMRTPSNFSRQMPDCLPRLSVEALKPMNPSQRCRQRSVISLPTRCTSSAAAAPVVLGSSGSYTDGSPETPLLDEARPGTMPEKGWSPSSSCPELCRLLQELSRSGFTVELETTVGAQMSGARMFLMTCFTSIFFSSL